jgi:hypothetical protein
MSIPERARAKRPSTPRVIKTSPPAGWRPIPEMGEHYGLSRELTNWIAQKWLTWCRAEGKTFADWDAAWESRITWFVERQREKNGGESNG